MYVTWYYRKRSRKKILAVTSNEPLQPERGLQAGHLVGDNRDEFTDDKVVFFTSNN